MKDWTNTRVLILGAARQGLAAARWLARHGAIVTLNDRRTCEELTPARAALLGLPITWALGGHPLDLLDSNDVLCLSGGVPLDNPLVTAAVVRGLPLTNDTQIFLEAAPCQTIGITGSAGKTTTTSLLGEMAIKSIGTACHNGSSTLASEDAPAVYIGGNIGHPLLNHVDEMTANDLAILEISSFQLEQISLSPNIAAVLNVTPNHLDRHGSMQAYTAAKQRILDFQEKSDIAILNRDDPGSWNLRHLIHGQLASFGFSPLPEGSAGTFLADGLLHLRQRNVEMPLLRADRLSLRGDHNLLNYLAAFAIGDAAGLKLDAMLEAASEFKAVPHRLELVRTWHGADWYNDSIATAPERTMAAIRSFSEPIVLLLGGRDKNLPWQDLATLVGQRVKHVVLFGEASGIIQAALQQASGETALTLCQGLDEAIQATARLVTNGDVVLFSPGGTSFDQFRDFEERGEAYRKWVSELS